MFDTEDLLGMSDEESLEMLEFGNLNKQIIKEQYVNDGIDAFLEFVDSFDALDNDLENLQFKLSIVAEILNTSEIKARKEDMKKLATFLKSLSDDFFDILQK